MKVKEKEVKLGGHLMESEEYFEWMLEQVKSDEAKGNKL